MADKAPARIAKADQKEFVEREWRRYLSEIRPHDLGWAAGIVDGEGCIFIRKAEAGSHGRINVSHGLGLKVTMGHKETIDRLAGMFGHGSRHEVRQGGYNDAWTWLVQATRAWPVLLALQPMIFTKAEEVLLALEFLILPTFTGRSIPPEILSERNRLFEAMRDAKPRNRL